MAEVRALVGAGDADRPLHPRARGDRRGARSRTPEIPGGRLHRRRTGARHAHQARPPGGGPGARCAMRPHHATVPFFAIGGIDAATSATCSRPAPRGCACCGRSRRRRTPSARRRSCGRASATRAGAVVTASNGKGSRSAARDERARATLTPLARTSAPGAARGGRRRRAPGAGGDRGRAERPRPAPATAARCRARLFWRRCCALLAWGMYAALLGGARLRGAAGLSDHRHLAGAGRRLDLAAAALCLLSDRARRLALLEADRVMGRIQAGQERR